MNLWGEFFVLLFASWFAYLIYSIFYTNTEEKNYRPEFVSVRKKELKEAIDNNCDEYFVNIEKIKVLDYFWSKKYCLKEINVSGKVYIVKASKDYISSCCSIAGHTTNTRTNPGLRKPYSRVGKKVSIKFLSKIKNRRVKNIESYTPDGVEIEAVNSNTYRHLKPRIITAKEIKKIKTESRRKNNKYHDYDNL